MRFITLGDIEKAEYVNGLLKLDLSQYDFILLVGDLSATPQATKLGKARAMEDKNFVPQGKDPKKFYEEQMHPFIKKLERVDRNFAKILKYIKIFGVWGNADFERLIKRVKPKSIEIIHNRIVKIGDFYLAGYNGHSMYPWEVERPNKKDIFGYTYQEIARDVHSFREEQIYSDLKHLTEKIPRDKLILLTHSPSYKILDKVLPEFKDMAISTYGERSRDGNVGSTGLRDFVLEYKPFLHIFGHIHEAKGIEKIGETTFVNTGSFDEKLEFADIEINRDVKIQFKRIT